MRHTPSTFDGVILGEISDTAMLEASVSFSMVFFAMFFGFNQIFKRNLVKWVKFLQSNTKQSAFIWQPAPPSNGNGCFVRSIIPLLMRIDLASSRLALALIRVVEAIVVAPMDERSESYQVVEATLVVDL